MVPASGGTQRLLVGCGCGEGLCKESSHVVTVTAIGPVPTVTAADLAITAPQLSLCVRRLPM
jgi:hypothetical protein